MKAKVIVTLKKEVSDPQGLAVTQSLESLQFKGIKGVRVGKFFEVELDGLTKEDAAKQIDAASETILSNPTIETYTFAIVED